MFRKIGYCIFVLMFSVMCFADFEGLRSRFTDSTGVLDTTGYAYILDRIHMSEQNSYDVHEVLYLADSSQSELLKMQECKENIKLTVIEKARLYGAVIDSAIIAEMDESDFNALWLFLLAPPVAGLEWFRRWWKQRKIEQMGR